MNASNPSIETTRKVLLQATIWLFAASALIGIFVVLTNAYSLVIGRVISTTSILGLLAFSSMNNILRTEDKRNYVRTLSITALVSNLIWCIPWLLAVWGVYLGSDLLWRIVLAAGVVSFNSTLAANFLSFKKTNELIQGLTIATLLSSGIIGLSLLAAIFGNLNYIGDMWRLLLIAGIVLVFGMIVTPILARAEEKKDPSSKPAVKDTVGEQIMRAEIEAEVKEKVRAEVEAEMREKIAAEMATKSEPAPAPEQTSAPEPEQAPEQTSAPEEDPWINQK